MTLNNDIAFERVDRSVSLSDANLRGSLFGLAPALVVVVAHIWFQGASGLLDSLGSLWWWIAVVVGIAVHEGLHAIGWMLAGRLPPGVISFGIDRQTLSPYAHTRQPLSINAYRFGTALPALGLGVAPALIGIIGNLPAFTTFGALFLFAAGGDLLILWLIRNDPVYAMVADHPSRAGCEVLLPITGHSR
ncbi:DUF3267 domain-containing protein [Chloroflexus sp.]|uniref:DUF3267 domain-containing protein n=1 Tax=Chloroflexus sp. TaxID=1904827 RepID=UPI00261CAFA5|nr:DUF3267 domain-containing protein [uncultured Chloroflexus sp.]